MKQPTTRQLINEAIKIERQMKEIDQLGELNPNKDYKRTPSKETRNKQALRGLQTRANKMHIKLPQLVGTTSSEKVQLQKQYLKAHLQINLNQINQQINAKPVPKSIQVMGKRMKTDGMTYQQIVNLKKQVDSYRKSLKTVEKKMREQGFDEELINALMSGKERFEITSDKAKDILGSFDNLGSLQVNPNHHRSAKDFYDALSMTLGSDLNPNNFFNRVVEKADISESIKSFVDDFSSDSAIKDVLHELKEAYEQLTPTQRFMFASTVDIESYVKELEKYLESFSDNYERINNRLWRERNRIKRLSYETTTFKYYN